MTPLSPIHPHPKRLPTPLFKGEPTSQSPVEAPGDFITQLRTIYDTYRRAAFDSIPRRQYASLQTFSIVYRRQFKAGETARNEAIKAVVTDPQTGFLKPTVLDTLLAHRRQSDSPAFVDTMLTQALLHHPIFAINAEQTRRLINEIVSEQYIVTLHGESGGFAKAAIVAELPRLKADNEAHRDSLNFDLASRFLEAMMHYGFKVDLGDFIKKSYLTHHLETLLEKTNLQIIPAFPRPDGSKNARSQYRPAVEKLAQIFGPHQSPNRLAQLGLNGHTRSAENGGAPNRLVSSTAALPETKAPITPPRLPLTRPPISSSPATSHVSAAPIPPKMDSPKPIPVPIADKPKPNPPAAPLKPPALTASATIMKPIELNTFISPDEIQQATLIMGNVNDPKRSEALRKKFNEAYQQAGYIKHDFLVRLKKLNPDYRPVFITDKLNNWTTLRPIEMIHWARASNVALDFFNIEPKPPDAPSHVSADSTPSKIDLRKSQPAPVADNLKPVAMLKFEPTPATAEELQLATEILGDLEDKPYQLALREKLKAAYRQSGCTDAEFLKRLQALPKGYYLLYYINDILFNRSGPKEPKEIVDWAKACQVPLASLAPSLPPASATNPKPVEASNHVSVEEIQRANAIIGDRKDSVRQSALKRRFLMATLEMKYTQPVFLQRLQQFNPDYRERFITEKLNDITPLKPEELVHWAKASGLEIDFFNI